MVENTFDSKGTHSTAREHILQQRSCLRELAPALATEHEQCIVITHMSHHHTHMSHHHTHMAHHHTHMSHHTGT